MTKKDLLLILIIVLVTIAGTVYVMSFFHKDVKPPKYVKEINKAAITYQSYTNYKRITQTQIKALNQSISILRKGIKQDYMVIKGTDYGKLVPKSQRQVWMDSMSCYELDVK